MAKETSGRKSDQKMKPYLVYQYLLRNTDENHFVTAEELVGYLQSCGIDAERRSIYKDIAAINKALWLLENDSTIEEVEDEIENGYFDDDKVIVYDKHKKGFYVRQRHFDSFDIRLIIECIYSSKYISQDEAERLVDIMKEYISNYQADDIRTDALVTNRIRTFNKDTLNNVSLIYQAMEKTREHLPEKITFKYLKYDISNLDNPIERHSGSLYSVSPFKLIITDGNYYLLAFDDRSREIRTYRVDRMKTIKRTSIPREGEEEFKKVDLRSYTQRTFFMFSGEREHLLIKARMSLLDTFIEKFGRKNVRYSKADDHHFMIAADVEISDQFFGWLCGFGSGVEVFTPDLIREKYKNYLKDIYNKYE